MRTLRLYGRADCELCDEMKAIVAEVALATPLVVEEIDISGDPELERRFGHDIPVLFVGDREAFRHRVTVRELRQRLAAAESGSGESK